MKLQISFNKSKLELFGFIIATIFSASSIYLLNKKKDCIEETKDSVILLHYFLKRLDEFEPELVKIIKLFTEDYYYNPSKEIALEKFVFPSSEKCLLCGKINKDKILAQSICCYKDYDNLKDRTIILEEFIYLFHNNTKIFNKCNNLVIKRFKYLLFKKANIKLPHKAGIKFIYEKYRIDISNESKSKCIYVMFYDIQEGTYTITHQTKIKESTNGLIPYE